MGWCGDKGVGLVRVVHPREEKKYDYRYSSCLEANNDDPFDAEKAFP